MARAIRKRSSSSKMETGNTWILFWTTLTPATRETRRAMSSFLYGIVT